MDHISVLLKEKKIEYGYNNTKIHYMTRIDETTISKHLNGKRTVSLSHLKAYCDCFRLDFKEVQSKYKLNEIDICSKGTLKTIMASVAGVGAGALVYNGVKTIIEKNCKNNS